VGDRNKITIKDLIEICAKHAHVKKSEKTEVWIRLQGVLAAKILTVYFVVYTLAVNKKSGQVSTCRIGPFPCQFYKNHKNNMLAIFFTVNKT
jgi:hypothetical protein